MNIAARNWNHLGQPLPTPEEMGAWDTASINDFFIPNSMLMENASREAVRVFEGFLALQSRVLIIMGGGNNGGDGACIARHLRDAGHQVLVCHTKALDKASFATKEHVFIAQKNGVPFVPLSFSNGVPALPPEHHDIAYAPHLIVDALLGTGFSGQLRQAELEIIRYINHLGKRIPVAAVDIPSGLDGLTGLPKPEAVRATCTVTFEAAKPGLVQHHAQEYTGTVYVRRIGIPTAVRSLHPASFYLLAPQKHAWPAKITIMHKGSAGRVLIFGGSKGITGAPVLAALGALRAGAGLVTAACPEKLEYSLRQGFPEIMTHPLGTGDTWDEHLLPDCANAVTDLPRSSALVLGPGIGRGAKTLDVIAAILKNKHRPPLVLDADGLFALGTEPGGASSPLLQSLHAEDCITPHPGEAARILGTTIQEVQADRVAALRTLTGMTLATVILKGVNTLISRQGTPVFIAPFATPSLAVGGSGDVLSGVIAALLSRARASASFSCNDAFQAACLAVYLHGKAGEDLDLRYPERGALAREIAESIAHVQRICVMDNSY